MTDQEKLKLRFGILAGRLDDFRPVLNGRILRRLKDMVVENFATEGALSTPRPWAPLAPSTIKQTAKVRRGMLRITDQLFDSLTKPRGTDDTIVRTTKDTLVFGTKTHHAQFHQFPGRLPVRQPLPDPVPLTVEQELRQMLREWVLEGKAA